MRRVYLYRLIVKYPDGALDSGWEPPGWDDWRESGDSGDVERVPFTWPRVRVYMSKGGADDRAELLRAYGAEVTVDRSLPVRWIEQEQLPGLEDDDE